MPRLARIVIPGLPHHVTQRGNNRMTVFHEDADYQRYLSLLAEQVDRWNVQVEAYCLMPNHSHILLTPQSEIGLARTVGRTHYRYAQYSHARYQQSGHLWQNRFFSCVLDEAHTWAALRYVERNPVRAGLVAHAEDWPWSSAAAHLGQDDATGLLDLLSWRETHPLPEWQAALQLPEDDDMLARLRLTTHTGRPLGAESFFDTLEALLGRRLRALTVGRPRKLKLEGDNR